MKDLKLQMKLEKKEFDYSKNNSTLHGFEAIWLLSGFLIWKMLMLKACFKLIIAQRTLIKSDIISKGVNMNIIYN